MIFLKTIFIIVLAHCLNFLMMVQKMCLECGNRLQGRIDKKFCNQHCRNAFHNSNKFVITHGVYETNSNLLQNLRILFQLIKESPKQEVFGLKFLQEKGFDYQLCTHSYFLNGVLHYQLYKYSYQIEGGMLRMVHQKNYRK